MQEPHPIDNYVSTCCGAEHNPDVADIWVHENGFTTAGCSVCQRNTEFILNEEFARRSREWVRVNQAVGLVALNSFVPDSTDYHMDLR